MTNPDPFPDNPTPQQSAPVEAADTGAGDRETVWRQAVEVLTRAVRLTYGSPAQPIDFADFLASVLVGVAANVGSLYRLTAGRPGSWEAELVERLAYGTVGDDRNELLAYRTEAVRVPLNVAALVEDEGRDSEPPVLGCWEAVDQAVAATGMTPGDGWTDDQWDTYEGTVEAIDAEIRQRYTAAYVDYAERFRQAVEENAATIDGLARSGVAVEVVTVTDPEGELDDSIVNPSCWDEPDRVVWQLWDRARQQLGLPNP